MSDSVVQNFENHRSIDKKWIGIAFGLLVTLVLALVGAFTSPYLVAIAAAIGAASTIALAVRLRVYAVRVQDRIIRLEMQLRLKDILDTDLAPRIPELTMPQIIGLRYASDAELPALMTQVLDEPIAKVDDIKKRVKDWQPDYLRV